MKQRNLTRPLLIAPLCLAALLGWTCTPSWAQDCDANAKLSVGNATAESGLVHVELRGSSLCPMNGFALAIGHDGSVVEFVKFEPGSFLTSHAGANLFTIDSTSSTFTNVAVFFSDPTKVPATSVPPNTLLGTLTYNILPGAPPGLMELRNETLTFDSPPVDNIFSAPPPNPQINPVLESGSITVGMPQTFSMSIEATVDTQIALQLRGTASKALLAFSAFLTYDPAVLAVSSASQTVTEEAFAGTVWANSATQLVTLGDGTIEIQALRGPTTLVAPGQDLPFLNLTLDILSCGGATTIAFDDSNVITNQFVDLEVGIHEASGDLDLQDVTISLGGSSISGFIRGNANGGAVDPADPAGSVDLADGIFMLQNLFMGGQAPPCADAADANDDGRYNLLDPIWVIQFLMGNAGSTLPAPFTQPGEDPTVDTLGCDTPPSTTCMEL